MSEVIREGDPALLYLDSKRSFLVKAVSGRSFHTHKGYVKLDDLIGRPYGITVKSSLGAEFRVLKPTVRDYVVKIARRTQILYPKDMGLLLLYAGIAPGSRVVEAGAGSGALTCLLASYVKPDGRVYSYEVRAEFLELARRNIEQLRLAPYVEFKLGDVTSGIEEVEVDAVVLDLATPWLAVPAAHKALKGSGILASFSPTVEQVVKTVTAMESSGFAAIETVECLLRRIQAKAGQTRPETLMIGHTGYLTFGRKALSD